MSIEPPDTCGLICGFLLPKEGPAIPIDWDAATNPNCAFERPVWLHFNLADKRVINWIESSETLPEGVRDVLLDNDSHTRHEVSEDGLALVIGDLHHDFNGDPEGFGTLRLYITKNLCLTGRRHPLKTTDNLRGSLTSGLELSSTTELLATLIDELAETFRRVVKDLENEVDEAEDKILAGRVHEQGPELGRVRRLIARLRRHVNGGRSTMLQGLTLANRWAGKPDVAEVRQSVERLNGIAQDLELVQERARLLQEEIAGRLNEATNGNLYLLSVMTTVLLPINLITGIFGMNTGGLPWAEHPSGFWWVIALMAVGVVTSLQFLHRRRIL